MPLTIIKELSKDQRGEKNKKHRMILCQCDCGNIVKTRYSSFLSGHTKSCGCLRIKKITSHGKSRSRTYKSYYAMLQRCLNTKSTYYNYYGGRGITICKRWMKFENFFEDMGDRPKGMTLDRIDSDGNYEPINCKWSASKEQGRNRKSFIKLSEDDIKKIKGLIGKVKIIDIARKFNIHRNTVYHIKSGKTWEGVA